MKGTEPYRQLPSVTRLCDGFIHSTLDRLSFLKHKIKGKGVERDREGGRLLEGLWLARLPESLSPLLPAVCCVPSS